jgi:muramoyltetrapeptide carboxypeptidase
VSYCLPPKLRHGDVVRFVSPASTPSRESIKRGEAVLLRLGLEVQVADHVFDQLGYLAGSDEDRLADFNAALRDPDVKAIIATRGGKGAYRIADGLDFDAAKRNPKLVVGFSETTILHMALMKNAGIAGIHGAVWDAETFGAETAQSFVGAVMGASEVAVHSRFDEPTVALTTAGKASGVLIGGNQDAIATACGWGLPSFKDAILLLEAFNLRLGQIDRQLTMLSNSGQLNGIRGIAIGQYTECGADATTQGGWGVIDVLRDRLHRLGVPVLGGLPIGHGSSPIALPLGTMATLDADRGVLKVQVS